MGNDPSGVKDLAFGSIAGSISKVFEHPFDLCKVRLQSQRTDRPLRFTGPLDCFKQTWSREGLRGLYRGLSAPIVGAAAENACLFLVYNQIQRLVDGAAGVGSSESDGAAREKPLSELALAAAGAGAVTSFVLTPIELVKVKMQVTLLASEGLLPAAVVSTTGGPVARMAIDFSKLPGPFAVLRQTIASTGIRGLWLGHSGTLLRETGGSSAWFSAFEVVSRAFMRAKEKKLGLQRGEVTKADLRAWELCVSGGAAGMAYNLALFPADTIKSAMQTRAELRPDLVGRVSFLQVAREIFAARGFRGLYAGCGITVARAAPSSAMIFLIYEELSRNFA